MHRQAHDGRRAAPPRNMRCRQSTCTNGSGSFRDPEISCKSPARLQEMPNGTSRPLMLQVRDQTGRHIDVAQWRSAADIVQSICYELQKHNYCTQGTTLRDAARAAACCVFPVAHPCPLFCQHGLLGDASSFLRHCTFSRSALHLRSSPPLRCSRVRNLEISTACDGQSSAGSTCDRGGTTTGRH